MASFLSKLETFDSKNFTKKENEIIKYIKENMKEVTTMNIEILAQRVNTGYSAIYGLLRKVQIKGYRDFLIAIAADVEIKSLDFENMESLMKKTYFDILNQNDTMINNDVMNQTINAIKGAYRIFVIGMGSTNALSQTLALELYHFGFNAFNLNENEEDLMVRSRFMNKNDLILAYSLFGDNESVNKALTIAKEKGVTIIAISGKDMSKAVQLSNWSHIISTPNQRANDHKIYVNKLLPWMYFTDHLINKIWLSDIVDKEFVMAQQDNRWDY
ncbi:MurR/RpiR family transcriptional regulator [Spiroplasma poulsonii]|uniref:MurR/RpiR family transcriptional regulator n=1 Tax=Spiroplasma poulsonii TaxID=2138 RepID=A0A3S0UNV4_9MOLU|nr:MurR/RpiR family transcriptional regulator [Spiroplasma poulsonii]MBW3058169.1 MurR/RpiR family transcriptional regulator [Spiroplasma poulsonii]RUP78279.1 MurR/RpiR family transcriptional regulator [Spiroplasma poulsonii]